MKIKWSKKYLSMGVTAFLVIVASLLVGLLIFNFPMLSGWVTGFFAVLTPILCGVAIAYVLNPILCWLEQVILPKVFAKKKKPLTRKWTRVLSVSLTLLFALLVIIVLLWLILPQLFDSVRGLLDSLPGYLETTERWLEGVIRDNNYIPQFLRDNIGEFSKSMESLINKVVPQLTNLLGSVGKGFMSVVIGVKDFLVGLIISVYLLYSKELFIGQCKKITYALFPKNFAAGFLSVAQDAHRIFGGFISGKLLDSLIIGIICFVGCVVFRFPYAVLISVIVGVTNVIPFFGPFIGAIPSAFLILLVSPKKALLFLIFILVLQQFDGNILGPKILGDSTGISSFWVIFAILVGASWFGMLGMFVGVPTFAVVYALVKMFIENRLMKKGLSTQTKDYISSDID